MAETYRIYDWRSLPARLVATLAAGLRDNSRVKMQYSGAKVGLDTLLLATCADALKILVWQNTKDGRKGHNPPKSILSSLIDPADAGDTKGFDSPADFTAWRNEMLKGGDANGRNTG